MTLIETIGNLKIIVNDPLNHIALCTKGDSLKGEEEQYVCFGINRWKDIQKTITKFIEISAEKEELDK